MTQKYIVRLSIDERKKLFEVIEKGVVSKERQNRARILLKADCGEFGENWKDPQISEAFYVSVKTVERIRKSLVEDGFDDTLNRKMPPERKRIIEGQEEAYLIALACGEPPDGRSGWTLSLLADKMVECKYVDAVSRDTISRAFKKTNLNLGKKKNGV